MKKLGYQLNTAGIGALQNFMDMEINFCQHFKRGDCTTLGRQLILHKQVIDRIFLGHNVQLLEEVEYQFTKEVQKSTQRDEEQSPSCNSYI